MTRTTNQQALSVNQQAALGSHATSYAAAYADYRVHLATGGVYGDERERELDRDVRQAWSDLSHSLEAMKLVETV